MLFEYFHSSHSCMKKSPAYRRANMLGTNLYESISTTLETKRLHISAISSLVNPSR